MKSNLAKSAVIALTLLMTACGTFKKAANLPDNNTIPTTTASSDPVTAVTTTLGDWQTMQTGGNISLNAGSNFSSSIQMRMVKDQAIYISLRPVLGIEVGKLIITADSLYAVDKVHKRFIAEKVSILTSGIPVTVSDVQDIFLGRPFIIGKGTLNEELMTSITTTLEGNTIILTPNENYKGYSYAFALDKNYRIGSLDILKAGSTTTDYKVKYDNVRNTTAGNIAHGLKANASVDNKKIAFSLSYKDIEWNTNVKIDRSIPNGYKRMSAKDLFSLFSN